MGVAPLLVALLSDAQTSVGLLGQKADFGMRKLLEKETPAAKIVGEVISNSEGVIQV